MAQIANHAQLLSPTQKSAFELLPTIDTSTINFA
jgi:hypothetical protein